MADIVHWLIEPFEFAFMQRALMSLLIVSVVGSIVGTFVVHKGLAASGSGLAHATLAGVAIAFVNGLSVALGALLAAVATGVGIGYVRSNSRVSYDTAIAIFFVSAFSLGILDDLAPVDLHAGPHLLRLRRHPRRLAGGPRSAS